MPAFPSPKKDVPRESVDDEVRRMLRNDAVGDVDCVEQADRLYTVTPHKRPGDGDGTTPGPVGATRRRVKKKATKTKTAKKRTSKKSTSKKKTR